MIYHHNIFKKQIYIIRRLRKTDNNRVAKATGATIVNRPEELPEDDVGKNCGLFEIKKIGDEYYAYFVKCKNPKSFSIILRGAKMMFALNAKKFRRCYMCL